MPESFLSRSAYVSRRLRCLYWPTPTILNLLEEWMGKFDFRRWGSDCHWWCTNGCESAKQAHEPIRLLMLVNDVAARFDSGWARESALASSSLNRLRRSSLSGCGNTWWASGEQWKGSKVHLPGWYRPTTTSLWLPECWRGYDFQLCRTSCSRCEDSSIVSRVRSLPGHGIGISKALTTAPQLPRAEGYSCIAEVRMIETIRDGKPSTQFMVVWRFDQAWDVWCGGWFHFWCDRPKKRVSIGRHSPHNRISAWARSIVNARNYRTLRLLALFGSLSSALAWT